MKQFFLILIFIIPNIVLASFPIDDAINDTIRKNGKIYVPIEESENTSFNKNLSNKNIESTVEKKKKPKKRSQRSKNILTSLGFLLVILFIFIKYKIFGLITNITLIINLFLLIGILTIFEATLTLPGIAGIILTVGMAVDANVLIFSRIREELKEKEPQSAIHDGFSRAFITIFDANITTLIAALILYVIGTGPVKGFAITLSIGIVTSMFTAIMCTRAMVNLVYGNKNVKELKI